MSKRKPIANPRVSEYDNKMPTNLRIEKDLKQKAKKESEEKNKTLSEIVNESLRLRYNEQK